jgi:hypothetical protein
MHRRYPSAYYRGYRRRPAYYYSAYPSAYYSGIAYAPAYYALNPYYVDYAQNAYAYAVNADYEPPIDVNEVHIGSARNPEVWLSQPNTAIHPRPAPAEPVFLYCERGRPVRAEPGSGTVRRPLLPIDGVYYQCSDV